MQTRTVTDDEPAVRLSRSCARRTVRAAALAVVAGASVVTLSGCSLDWTSMARPLHAEAVAAEATAAPRVATAAVVPSAASSPAPTASSTASSANTATAPAAVPAGDLGTGSATHVLPAGASQLAVDYWTTDAPASLGGAATTTVQLSAHLEGTGAGTETRVSRFRATAPSAQPDGATTASVLVDDAGSFALTAPFSYSTAVQVPTSGVGGTTTVRLQWDLLVETEPGSDVWFRQTVLDQLVIALPAANTTATPGASS